MPPSPPALPDSPACPPGAWRRPRVQAALGVAAVVAAGLFLRAYPPSSWPWWPHCPWHEQTGWHCPGCGLTRAGMAALRGDFRAAAGHHAAAAVLGPVAAGYAAWCAGYALWRDRWPAARLSPVLLWALLGAFVLFGLLRNLPGFTCLAP